VVNGSDHAEHKCNHIRQLYSKGDRFERMPELTISCDFCDSKCIAYNTHNISLRTDNLLHRGKCRSDIKCRDELLMVNRGDYPEHKCVHSWKLYS
jgi:hypothetical protein